MKRCSRFDLRNQANWPSLAQEAGYNAEDFAALCQISARQLRRLSRKYFGRGLQQWLDQQRLLAAGSRLRESECIKGVAFTLGYKQVSHFCRQFKRFYGMTPSTFILNRRIPGPVRESGATNLEENTVWPALP